MAVQVSRISRAGRGTNWAAGRGYRRGAAPVGQSGYTRWGKGPALAGSHRREWAARVRPALVRALLLLGAVPLLILALSLLAQAAATSPAPPPVEWVVQPGDTLWEIAMTYTGRGQDVRATVWEIQEYNQLARGHIVPGQVIRIPAHLVGR